MNRCLRPSLAGLRLALGIFLTSGALLLAAPARAPLADAMERKDLAAVKALLGDSDVNQAQVDGMTALHWAAHHEQAGVVTSLLAAKANPNVQNRYGVTPLALACTNGNDQIVRLLLDGGADANLSLRGGETPLMTAARTGRIGPVKGLLAKGAKVDATLEQGQTALMWAAADGHLEVVEALIAAGADFRRQVDTGFTPMLFAARAGHADIVRALLKAGVDINAASTPTIRPGNKQPRRGSSALTIAVENGRFELASSLLDLGADPGDMRSGYTPLHILTWVRKPDRGEDEGDPIPQDPRPTTSEQLIAKLIAKGADVNARLTGGPSGGGRINRNGCTPLMLAADTADTGYMRLLIAAGADATITNVDGATPLMAAAGLGTRAAEEEAGTEDEAVEAIGYLLGLGADINAVSLNGDTAMHGAAFANFPKVVKFLDTKGAKIEVWNQPSKQGWIPLRVAEGHRFGNFKPSFETVAAIKEVMLAHGAVIPPPMAPIPVIGY